MQQEDFSLMESMELSGGEFQTQLGRKTVSFPARGINYTGETVDIMRQINKSQMTLVSSDSPWEHTSQSCLCCNVEDGWFTWRQDGKIIFISLFYFKHKNREPERTGHKLKNCRGYAAIVVTYIIPTNTLRTQDLKRLVDAEEMLNRPTGLWKQPAAVHVITRNESATHKRTYRQ